VRRIVYGLLFGVMALAAGCGGGGSSASSGSAAATHFSVVAPGAATAGTSFHFTVTALNASNNIVTGYTGTVHFTSTDGSAVVPPMRR